GIVILCFSYVFSQFYRAFLAVMTPVLSAEFGMTSTEFAYASGAWFVAFALFQFPVGILLDKVGPRKTAGVIFTIFAGAGTFLFAYASSPTQIIIAMALIGIGCSVALMAPMYIFVRSYDATKFATLVSTFIGIGSLGNIASSEPLAAAIELFGWRESCIALGIGTVIVGLAIFVFVRDPESAQTETTKGGFLDLLKIRQLWPIFPIILGGYVVAAGLRGSWIGPFHSELYGYDTLQIGRATLYMSIALVLGTLFYGPLDRMLNSRKKVVVLGNVLVLAGCVAMAMHLPASPFWGTAAFVFLGFIGASYAVQMAHGKSFVPEHLAGRGVTLLNFCSIGGAGIFQWISGPVVETFATDGNLQSQYTVLFTYYAIVMFVTISIYLFSRDAKPSQQAS
ncbi:MAG: MFS transporter, partial [Pseudomonadota bacterium]